jgi:non-specific serine/threonine protein kinase
LEEAWPDAGDASDEELAWLTYASALAAMTRGDSGVARALMADAVAKFRATDDINGLVWALCDSAVAESTSTEPGETEAYVAAFQAVAGPLQLFGAAYALWARAHARWRAGDTVGARMAVLESLQATRPFDDHLARGLASELLAWITQRDGSPHDAAVQLGRAAAAFASAGSSIDAVDYLAGGHKTCQAQLVGQLGPDGFATAYDAGFREEPSWDAGSAAAVAEPDRTPAPNQPSRLTRREAEVAGLVAQGLTNKEIATRLVLSQRTVEAHVEHALVKLGFRSRGQLAAWVVSQDDAAT